MYSVYTIYMPYCIGSVTCTLLFICSIISDLMFIALLIVSDCLHECTKIRIENSYVRRSMTQKQQEIYVRQWHVFIYQKRVIRIFGLGDRCFIRSYNYGSFLLCSRLQ